MLKYISIMGVALSLLAYFNLEAAPKKDLWAYWQQSSSRSRSVINHSAWTRLLQKYDHHTKNGINLFAYAVVTPQDKKKLQHYLDYLQKLSIRQYNTRQQEAYWINLYNAETVNLILQHYPIKSILDINISPGWFSRGPWDEKVLYISGKAMSLNDIEHRILRPVFRDNRLHYALNCASLGCPNLQRQAFTADRLNRMLNTGAKAYVNSYRGAHFTDGNLIVSKIYIWYKSDFGGTDVGIIAHLKKYARSSLLKRLNSVSKIGGSDYNWQLNVFATEHN